MEVNKLAYAVFKQRLLCIIGLLFVFGLVLFVGLMNVSKPGEQGFGCFQDCAAPIAGNGRSLHIFSLNILHEYPDMTTLPQRLNLIAAEINTRAVDIALLQEVPFSRKYGDSAAYLAELTGMNHVYFRANGNQGLIGFEEGVAILSRYPLEAISFIELKPPVGFFENRVALHATAVTPVGEFDLFVTHLTSGDAAANLSQAESLREFVTKTAEHTAVIAGDINAEPHTSQVKMLSTYWIDTYQNVHPNDPVTTCCIDDLSSAAPTGLDKQVDYLFLALAQPGVVVEEARLVMERPFATPDGPLWASDHVGLLVTLTLPPGN